MKHSICLKVLAYAIILAILPCTSALTEGLLDEGEIGAFYEEEQAPEVGEVDLYAPEVHCHVRVSDPYVEVESVSLDYNQLNMITGEQSQLHATVLPSNATDASLTWSNSDESVASLDTDGTVTALKKGSTVITVTSNNGKSDNCIILVEEPFVPVESISLDIKQAKLKVGRQLQLHATFVPENATDQSLRWISNNDSIVTVDENGLVTAIRASTAIVSAKTSNSKVSSCYFITFDGLSPDDVPSQLDLCLGYSYDLGLESEDEEITYTVQDMDIISVSSNGVIRPKKAGTTVVTVYSDGEELADCYIAVYKKPSSVKLNMKKARMKSGDRMTLEATVPSGTCPSITWSSGNTGAVQVNEMGEVTAVGEGYAVITAKTINGKKAECTINVTLREADKPTCRALLIGEANFPSVKDHDISGKKDISKIKRILDSVKGQGDSKWVVTTTINRTSSQVLSDIRNTFSGAEVNDISLFYITTHGDKDSEIDSGYAGWLETYPGGVGIKLQDLADALCEIPGRIIVIIESCGSGAAVYGSNTNKRIIAKKLKEFDNEVISVFTSVDTGVLVQNATGSFVIQNKFYVLTSAAYQESSWEENGCALLVRWISEGVKEKGRMPADSNCDNKLELRELFEYLKKRGENKKIKHKGAYYKQHAQVYPKNCSFLLFKR